MYEVPCLLPAQYNLLYSTSWLTLVSGSYALLKKNDNYSILPFSIFATSLIYWKYPVYGWRRNLDVYLVQSTAVIQAYLSFYSSNFFYYNLFSFVGGSCYCISHYFFRKKYYWTYTCFHIGLHVLTNIGNMCLYHNPN